MDPAKTFHRRGIVEGFRHMRLLIQSSAIGTAIGIMPGLGAPVAHWISYAVARRTSEFGVRMALGASPVRIVGEILREAMSMTFLGLILGLVVVGVAAKAAATMLFGVSPHDAITMVAATAFVVVAASLAGLMPALRAARVDPLVALRNE